MKKETGLLLAGSIGLILGLTIYGVRRFWMKKEQEYDDYYNDYHRHFEKIPPQELSDGIEYLSV